MITRLSERDKKRAVQLYKNFMDVNEIRLSLLPGHVIAQKTIRYAIIEGGYGIIFYCKHCKAHTLYVAAMRGGREFCNECGSYV